MLITGITNVIRHRSLLLAVTLVAASIASSSVHSQQASLQDGILNLPYVLVTDSLNGETAFSAELSQLADTEPVQFKLLAAIQVPLNEDGLQSTFTDNILFIPDIAIDGLYYWAELAVVSAGIFELREFGSLPAVRSSNPLGLSRQPVWQRLEGDANDIGVGADGSVWVIGTDERGGGFGIYHWNGSGWGRVEGGAVRIDVDPAGNPWIVNNSHDIYRRVDNRWLRVAGEARDIGIGADGSVWVTSGGGTFRWNGVDWDPHRGSGTRIDVDPSGNPWVINSSDHIYQLIAGRWTRQTGAGRDIGIGADGSVWIVGTSDDDGGHGVYRWTGESWNRVVGSLRHISVDSDGYPWGASSTGKIYRAH